MHLTDLSIRSLKPTDNYKTYWDDSTPGFGLRVTAGLSSFKSPHANISPHPGAQNGSSCPLRMM
jgi:hypothetical protein